MSDKLRQALSEYDSYIKPCPVNNPRGSTIRSSDDCPLCGARANQNCGREATASYHLVRAVRAIVGESA